MAFLLASGILSIIAGILILVFPGFLRFIVGAYLVLAGILTIIP